MSRKKLSSIKTGLKISINMALKIVDKQNIGDLFNVLT